MKRQYQNNTLARFFGGVGATAIILGGLVSAFGARHPAEFIMWMSAYLVLVVGVLQIVLAVGLHYSSIELSRKYILPAFAAYNVGNLAVLLGTYLTSTQKNGVWLVDSGGFLLALAMLLLLLATRHAPRTRPVVAFYVVTIIVLVTMPIGLVLARH